MRISKIMISLEVQEKIFKKHNILREEIEKVFFDEPYFFRTRSNRYVAIGFIGRYVTVVFDYEQGNAFVITSYLSSEWQKNLYKAKWKK